MSIDPAASPRASRPLRNEIIQASSGADDWRVRALDSGGNGTGDTSGISGVVTGYDTAGKLATVAFTDGTTAEVLNYTMWNLQPGDTVFASMGEKASAIIGLRRTSGPVPPASEGIRIGPDFPMQVFDNDGGGPHAAPSSGSSQQIGVGGRWIRDRGNVLGLGSDAIVGAADLVQNSASVILTPGVYVPGSTGVSSLPSTAGGVLYFFNGRLCCGQNSYNPSTLTWEKLNGISVSRNTSTAPPQAGPRVYGRFDAENRAAFCDTSGNVTPVGPPELFTPLASPRLNVVWNNNWVWLRWTGDHADSGSWVAANTASPSFVKVSSSIASTAFPSSVSPNGHLWSPSVSSGLSFTRFQPNGLTTSYSSPFPPTPELGQPLRVTGIYAYDDNALIVTGSVRGDAGSGNPADSMLELPAVWQVTPTTATRIWTSAGLGDSTAHAHHPTYDPDQPLRVGWSVSTASKGHWIFEGMVP